LSGDTTLISPAHQGDFAHLARFARDAPIAMQNLLWQKVARATRERLFESRNADADAPRWLSTSGLGVYWLHVRVCDKPKYYTTQMYKKL
jgi:hypothetical protein